MHFIWFKLYLFVTMYNNMYEKTHDIYNIESFEWSDARLN